jgi:hypothetical protein
MKKIANFLYIICNIGFEDKTYGLNLLVVPFKFQIEL